MSEKGTQPTFLARVSYRKRRMRDIACVLPVLGAGLFSLPLLWGEGRSNSSAVLYIFGIWLMLIMLAAVVGYLIADRGDATDIPD